MTSFDCEGTSVFIDGEDNSWYENFATNVWSIYYLFLNELWWKLCNYKSSLIAQTNRWANISKQHNRCSNFESKCVRWGTIEFKLVLWIPVDIMSLHCHFLLTMWNRINTKIDMFFSRCDVKHKIIDFINICVLCCHNSSFSKIAKVFVSFMNIRINCWDHGWN